jgi:hypothetical protein
MPIQNSGAARVAALPGQPRARQHAENVGDDQRGEGQDDRVRQDLQQDGGDRPALEERQPHLALQQVGEIDEVLLPHRLIEAELLQHRLLLVGVQVLVDEGGERRARHQPEHEEQDGGDRQQRQRVVGEALEDESHGSASSGPRASCALMNHERAGSSRSGRRRVHSVVSFSCLPTG